jgi:hypothetical protein
MRSLHDIENKLRQNIEIRNITEIPELQEFNNYEEIKQLHKSNKIVFGYTLQGSVIDNFGTTGQFILDKVLLSSPVIIIILSIIFSILKSHYFLLVAIPIVLISTFLTTPSIMKQGKSLAGIIMILTIIFGIYFITKDFSIGFLLLSYGIPNFLLTVNRQLNMDVFEEAILSSEIVFIYYFLRGECFIKKLDDGKLICVT